MNLHLNSRQISSCLIGRATPEQTRHARQCEACRAEVALLEQSLSSFRHAVRDWSGHAGAAGYQPAWKASRLFLMSSPLEGRASAKPAARAGLSSFLVHAAAVAMIFSIGTSEIVQRGTVEQIQLIAPRIFVSQPSTNRAGGGGGGGQRSPFPATGGTLPKPSPKQFVPPGVEHVQAELLVPPSIVVPPGMPEIAANNYGEFLGRAGIPSGGPGSGGGIGSGRNGGVGSGRGPGAGPGEGGGGVGGGPYTVGGGVSAPTLIHRVDPEYSEDARKSKWQGTVILNVVIDAQGRPREIRILQPVGMGLDEKAVEAVEQWRFRPGVMHGKPVAVFATIEVSFRLL